MSSRLNCFIVISLLIIVGCGSDSTTSADDPVEENQTSFIEEAVKKMSGNNNGEYFTVKELCTIVEKLAADANKDIDDVYTILKKEEKFFETKWTYKQKAEVVKIIEEAVAKAKESDGCFTAYQLAVMAKKIAFDAKKDVEHVFTILKKETKLFETKWKFEQKDEAIKIIAEAVKKAKDSTSTGEYLTNDDLNAIVKKMSAEAKVDAEKVMAVLKEGKKFYQTKWKKEQLKKVVALVEEAIKEIS